MYNIKDHGFVVSVKKKKNIELFGFGRDLNVPHTTN